MRVLFAYRYGILGGVCTQLINRLRLLSSDREIDAHLLFAGDYGISTTLRDYAHLHFETDPGRVRQMARRGGFDAAVVIDTPEYLKALEGVPGLPLVAEVHTTVETGLAYLNRRSWSADGYIVPSEYSRRLLRGRFGVPEEERVEVVPNCLDMSLFPSIELAKPPERPTFAWIGKLDDHKNWRGFLSVASELVERVPECRFWLVGGYTAPREAEEALLEEMARRRLVDRCLWLPRVEYRAMHRLYAAVRQSGGCAIVTSINESFGMSVLEALVCGCPVVASDVGAIPEIAPERPNLQLYPLPEYGRAAELAAGLVAEGPDGPTGRALAADRTQLEERYSAQTIASRYAATLRSLVADAAARPRAEVPATPAPAPAGDDPPEADPALRAAVDELRLRIPGGEEIGEDPAQVVREASRILGGRSYRLARLVAARDRGPTALARLPLRLWRELRKSP